MPLRQSVEHDSISFVESAIFSFPNDVEALKALPCSCPACGGDRLSKLGEDVTETFEVIPRS